MRDIESWQAAYIAGIIDGEGYVRLNETSDKSGLGVMVGINMCSELTIEIIHETIGIGNITESKTEKGRPIFRLRVTHRQEVLDLLLHVERFLITKKEHAGIVIQYCRESLAKKCPKERQKELLEKLQCLQIK